jgi:hypothetical protein
MQLKSIILPGLGLRTLRQIVDKLDIDVDRRSRQAMQSALSRSRRVSADDLLQSMRKDEIRAVCEGMGLSGKGRRAELLEQLKSIGISVTEGLEDGTRIKSYKGGWAVVDGRGLFLVDPRSATWVVSPNKEMPAAVFPTPAAAYLAWMQAQEVAKGQTPRTPGVLRQTVSGTAGNGLRESSNPVRLHHRP